MAQDIGYGEQGSSSAKPSKRADKEGVMDARETISSYLLVGVMM